MQIFSYFFPLEKAVNYQLRQKQTTNDKPRRTRRSQRPQRKTEITTTTKDGAGLPGLWDFIFIKINPHNPIIPLILLHVVVCFCRCYYFGFSFVNFVSFVVFVIVCSRGSRSSRLITVFILQKPGRTVIFHRLYWPFR